MGKSEENSFFVEVFVDLLKGLNSIVWGPVMLVLLVGTGLYLNFGLKFYSFRNWMRAYKCLWDGRDHKSEHGEISPWNALMTAIAAASVRRRSSSFPERQHQRKGP